MSKYPIRRCPDCGSAVFYIRQKISGTGTCFLSLKEENEIDNSSLHDNLQYKLSSKYAYCSNCNKRLFKLTEEMKLY